MIIAYIEPGLGWLAWLAVELVFWGLVVLVAYVSYKIVKGRKSK